MIGVSPWSEKENSLTMYFSQVRVVYLANHRNGL